MSKRNVAYIKPKEPAFLARLKEQVGFKEGPTVDTKREALPEYNSDDSEGEDQQPVIVVVNPGDLSAEEVAEAKRVTEEAPADLDKRVVFKKPVKKRGAEEDSGSNSKQQKSGKSDVTSNRTKVKKTSSAPKGPLSFCEDPEEEECCKL
ncbi:uncharacterized protein KIAA1143 homolog [Halyomorpha halys]|uniref:uncharacterized protein KIAA1143 homolog n=1 Tax=Halyomorpha halys TaxID=286706 RepID=UPI0006D51599